MLSLLISQIFAFHVVIDPGHGGRDSGASYYGMEESTITLNIAKELQNLLKKERIANSMTRTGNTTADLKARAKKAHKNAGEVFLSIHTNSSPSKKIKGVEIFFENQLDPSQEALFLAYREEQLELGEKTAGRPSKFKGKYKNELAAILDDLSKTKYQRYSHLFAQQIKEVWQKEEGIKVRIKQAPFFVISSVNMPSVLVEVGFLSNKEDAERLKNKAYQKKVAQILYKAVLEWKEKWTFQRSKL